MALTINLGTILSQFSNLAGSGISNVSPDTSITGDVGSIGGVYTGLISSQIDGIFHPIDDTATQMAQAEFDLAFAEISALPLTVAGAWASGSGPFSGIGGFDLSGKFLGSEISLLGPGVYSFSGDAIFPSCTLTLDAQGDPNAAFVFQIGDDLIVGADTSIILANGANSCNVFFVVNDITNIGAGAEFIGNILSLGTITLQGGNIVIGRLLTNTGEIVLQGSPSLIANVCICYAKGTNILTPDGYVPIENLRAGDEIITCGEIPEGYAPTKRLSDGKVQKIVWTGHYTANNLNKKSYPVCISKNALGKNMPRTDVFVSPDHGVFVSNNNEEGKFISAKNLINGSSIYQDTNRTSVDYYHIEVADHSIIIADGLFAESYLDSNKYIRKQNFATSQALNEPVREYRVEAH